MMPTHANTQTYRHIKGKDGYGNINTLGKIVIPPIYESLSGFYNGVACAALTTAGQDTRYILLDSTNRSVEFASLQPKPMATTCQLLINATGTCALDQTPPNPWKLETHRPARRLPLWLCRADGSFKS